MKPTDTYDKTTGYEKAATVEIKEEWIDQRRQDFSWGAVAGGWFVAAAAAMILYALGAAGGITAIRLADPASLEQNMVLSAAIWLLVTWVVSLSLGGYFAGAATRTADKRLGGLHGIAVWAVSTILTILVTVGGTGAIGAAGIHAVGKGGEVVGLGFVTGAERGSSVIPANLRAALKERIVPVSGKAVSGETLALIAGELIQGDARSAADALVLNTSLTREEARSVVSDLSAQARDWKARIQAAADQTAKYTAAALFGNVLISLLSLLAAFIAGRIGAHEYVRHTGYTYEKTYKS